MGHLDHHCRSGPAIHFLWAIHLLRKGM